MTAGCRVFINQQETNRIKSRLEFGADSVSEKLLEQSGTVNKCGISKLNGFIEGALTISNFNLFSLTEVKTPKQGEIYSELRVIIHQIGK